ncbi:hypothetical protein CWI39_0633p0010, partial [Hamiltosporidium magnivora]
GVKILKPKNNTPLISQGGTTLEEPTNNINEESDLEEETIVVKEKYTDRLETSKESGEFVKTSSSNTFIEIQIDKQDNVPKEHNNPGIDI